MGITNDLLDYRSKNIEIFLPLAEVFGLQEAHLLGYMVHAQDKSERDFNSSFFQDGVYGVHFSNSDWLSRADKGRFSYLNERTFRKMKTRLQKLGVLIVSKSNRDAKAMFKSKHAQFWHVVRPALDLYFSISKAMHGSTEAEIDDAFAAAADVVFETIFNEAETEYFGTAFSEDRYRWLVGENLNLTLDVKLANLTLDVKLTVSIRHKMSNSILYIKNLIINKDSNTFTSTDVEVADEEDLEELTNNTPSKKEPNSTTALRDAFAVVCYPGIDKNQLSAGQVIQINKYAGELAQLLGDEPSRNDILRFGYWWVTGHNHWDWQGKSMPKPPSPAKISRNWNDFLVYEINSTGWLNERIGAYRDIDGYNWYGRLVKIRAQIMAKNSQPTKAGRKKLDTFE